MDWLASAQQEYSGETFKGLKVDDLPVSGLRFYECIFVSSRFHQTQFKACQFHECLFRECDINLIEIHDSAFREVRFERSKVIGVNWTQAVWGEAGFLNSISFTHSVLNYSTFSGLKLPRLIMSDCTARDVAFSDADLTGADFRRTDFTNSLFHHTNLTEADFTGAYNYTINAAHNTLKQAKFSLPEARALLYSLDIVLVEED